MPEERPRVVRLTPRLRSVGSDLEDGKALRAYLGPAQVQVSAAVDACKARLPQGVLDAWYALAKDIIRWVSLVPLPGQWTSLAITQDTNAGRALRDRLNATTASLAALGCGDVAKAVHDAPPAKAAAPPVGTPNPFLSLFQGDMPIWLIIAAVYFLTQKRR